MKPNDLKKAMTKVALLGGALLLLAAVGIVSAPPEPAHATDPITLETIWNQNTLSIATTGVTAMTIDPGGFGSSGYAVLGQNYIQNGLDGTTFGQSAVITSTITNIYGLSYTVLAVGATAQLQITQTLKTPPPSGYVANPAGFNNSYPASNYFISPVISTSSVITIPNGFPYSDSFSAKVVNPIFYFTALNKSATYYFSVDIARPKLQ